MLEMKKEDFELNSILEKFVDCIIRHHQTGQKLTDDERFFMLYPEIEFSQAIIKSLGFSTAMKIAKIIIACDE